MINRIIDWCASNRFLVFTGAVALTVWGIWAMTATPLDAVPDISDVQVIVSTEWMGRSPDIIEDQITFPIVTSLLSAPRVRTVHGFTDFGISYVYVIFEDGTYAGTGKVMMAGTWDATVMVKRGGRDVASKKFPVTAK